MSSKRPCTSGSSPVAKRTRAASRSGRSPSSDRRSSSRCLRSATRQHRSPSSSHCSPSRPLQSASQPRRSRSRTRRSASQPLSRAATPSPSVARRFPPHKRTIRKDDVVITKFDIDIPISKESSGDWVLFDPLEIELSDEVRSKMEGHAQLSVLLNNYQRDDKIDCSLKIQHKKIYAHSTKEDVYYNVDITEIMPSGKVRLHWYAYPKESIVLETTRVNNSDEEEDADEELEDRLKVVNVENDLMKSKIQDLENEMATLRANLAASQNEVEVLQERINEIEAPPVALDAADIEEFFGSIAVREDAPIQQGDEELFENFDYEMAAVQGYQEEQHVNNVEEDEAAAEVVQLFPNAFLNAAEMEDQFPVGHMEDVVEDM